MRIGARVSKRMREMDFITASPVVVCIAPTERSRQGLRIDGLDQCQFGRIAAVNAGYCAQIRTHLFREFTSAQAHRTWDWKSTWVLELSSYTCEKPIRVQVSIFPPLDITARPT